MTATAAPAETTQGWFNRAESWLDARGKGACIASMVLGSVLFWPVGLAILFYMIWRKDMFKSGCRARSHHRSNSFRTSGNNAFDSYKADTLRRLEEEQEAFEAFLQRLRDAKDKAEFDQFMDDRATRAREEAVDAEPVEA